LTGACGRGSSASANAPGADKLLVRPALDLESYRQQRRKSEMAIGSDIVARAMKREGVTDFFYIMGAPMLGVEKACMELGLRGIDVRHEQAAAMAGSPTRAFSIGRHFAWRPPDRV
jgi:hypothetical protein